MLEHQTRERRLKLSVQDAVDTSELDRRQLLEEIQKQHEVVHDLLDERDGKIIMFITVLSYEGGRQPRTKICHGCELGAHRHLI